MKKLAVLIAVLTALPALCGAGDVRLGLGYPYLSLEYDGGTFSGEGRYTTGSGIKVYAARGYWNFYDKKSVRGFTGLEAGYIKFDTLDMQGTGYEAAPFLGGEYALSDNISFLMDFAPTMIMLKHAVYSDIKVSGMEFVMNAAVYYRFGGPKRDRKQSEKASSAGARPLPASPVPAAVPVSTAAAAAVPGSEAATYAEWALLENLKSEDWKVRRNAVFQLGKSHSQVAVSALVGSMNDASEKVRSVAALALAHTGNRAAYGPLYIALKDESPQVRASAANALGTFKNRRTLKVLRELLKDPVEEVRKAAGAAILKIKTSGAGQAGAAQKTGGE